MASCVCVIAVPQILSIKLGQVAKRAPQWLFLHEELTAELGASDAAGVVKEMGQCWEGIPGFWLCLNAVRTESDNTLYVSVAVGART